MAEVVTFYGTDGSGKSTIAQEFSTGRKDGESIMFGASSYKQWLTPEIARMTLGANHALSETPTGPIEKLRLYEDIAIATYGYARLLADGGTEAVIDSDPYLKRIVWGTLGLDDKHAADYIKSFEDRMIEGLDLTEGPDVVVGVNVGENAISQEELFARITSRAGNTEYDPTEIGELQRLDARVNAVWEQMHRSLQGLSLIDGFNNRLANTTFISIQNPNCEPDQILPVAQGIAADIRQQVSTL